MHKLDDKKLCVICSGSGFYCIYNRIPFYLHSTPQEFSKWIKPINELIEDITGINISRVDGLPQKICSVCISYLKHATIFRQQAIDNMQSLQRAKELSENPKLLTYDDQDDTMQNAIPSGSSCAQNIQSTNYNGYFGYPSQNTNNTSTSKYFNNQLVNYTTGETFENLKHEIDLFFSEDDEDDDDEEIDGADADDDETGCENNDEEEKPFREEDDLSNFDGIGINLPDNYKERKCESCKRRFMLNDTYEEHLKECVEAKLMTFIMDCHQLLTLKRHKAISAHEFIRRMIFSVKSLVRSLALCYKDMSRPSRNALVATVNLSANNDFNAKNGKNHPKKLFKTIDQDIFNVNDLVTTLMDNQSNNKIVPSGMTKDTNIRAPTTVLPFPKIQNFVAKCPSCQNTFESLEALEMHNRQLHNIPKSSTSVSSSDNFSDTGGGIGVTRRRSSTDDTVSSNNQLLDLLSSDDYSQEGIVNVMELIKKSPKVVNYQLNKK